jgi:hypothetical protein
MKTQTKRLFVVVMIVAFALVVYAGNAWAQSDPTAANTATPPANMLQQMEQRFGPQVWAEHIRQMTQIHGAEFVSQRLGWMAQQESRPNMNGEGRGMGVGMGMMQQRQGRMGEEMNGGMRGRSMMGNGMMGRGMRAQDGWWGFTWNRGPNFWNNTPTTAPTPTE